MFELAREGHLVWYQSHDVSSLSLSHTLIPLRVILTYKIPYSRAHIAQTSGPPLERSGGTLADTQ
jgi:hypothetical protein